MTAPWLPGVKSRNRSSWPRIAAEVGLERRRGRAGSAPPTDRTGRRSSRSRRPRRRPGARRSAGGAGARRSARGGRRGASRRTGRSRCSRRSDGRSPVGPPAPASSLRGSPASAARRAVRPGLRDCPRPSPSQAHASSRLDEAGGQLPFNHAPYAIVRPLMQTTLARRQRHRRALQRQPRGRAGSTFGRIVVVVLVVLLLTTGLAAGTGAVFAVGAYNHYAAGLPDPVEALNNIDFEQQTIIYDRTGKVELARLGDLKRELVTYDELPGEIIDATTSIEDKDFWSNPGFDPAGIVSAGARHGLRQAARRIDDHPAARPRPAPPARGVRGLHLRAQGARDHPVDPADPGLPGRGRQEDDHHGLPQPELLRQPELRREGRGEELLRQVARRPDPRPGRDPRRDPPVADEVRPHAQRRPRSASTRTSPRARTARTSSSSSRPSRRSSSAGTRSST